MTKQRSVVSCCILSLQADKNGLEVKVQERDGEIEKLRETIRQVEATPTKPDTCNVYVQATPTQPDSMEAGVQATPTCQPGAEVGIQTEGAELPSRRTTTETVFSEKVKGESLPPPPRTTVHEDVYRLRGGAISPRTSSVPDHVAQNTSLESEMRRAGVEVTDPYDSSEGVGFSDSNMDEVPGSTHSLESFKSDRVKDTAHEKSTSQSAESAVPIASQSIAEEREMTVGVAEVPLDLQEEESSDDEELSTGSDKDLRTAKRTSESSGD